MAPLVVLIISFVLFRGIGIVFPHFADWQYALRGALGMMFLLTASAHWGKGRSDLVRMVPDKMGSAGFWVSFTGLAELAAALGLQISRIAPWAAAAAIAMLCCLFPANVKAAREHLTIRQKSVLPVFPRLAIQIIFVAALAASVWPR